MPDTSGETPPKDELIYPVGMTMSASMRYLMVVNSNFDLKYNAGTLTLLDMNLLTIPVDENAGLISEDDSERYLDEKSFIKSEETVFFGAFASDIDITASGKQAVIPVRGARSVVVIDIDENGDDILSCGQDSDLKCDDAHTVSSNGGTSLPIEPFEVTTFTMDVSDVRTVDFALTTHLYGGQVSLIKLNDKISGSAPSYTPVLEKVLQGVIPGASGIAVNPVNNDIYVSGRDNSKPYLAVLNISQESDEWFFDQSDHLEIDSEIQGGTDARGIAVSKDGKNAYVVTRSPSSLLKIDTERNIMSDMVMVGASPSTVRLFLDDKGTQDDSDDEEIAFVLCFLTNQVYIIDPKIMKLLAVRSTGAGPQSITFDNVRNLFFVANFGDSTISIINATSPYDHLRDTKGRIVKIGIPTLPQDHD